jgi:hypothetical protein
VCDLDVMGDPSKLNVIRKPVSFTRGRSALLLVVERKSRGGSGTGHDHVEKSC